MRLTRQIGNNPMTRSAISQAILHHFPIESSWSSYSGARGAFQAVTKGGLCVPRQIENTIRRTRIWWDKVLYGGHSRTG